MVLLYILEILIGHELPVISVCFSPDGKTMAIGPLLNSKGEVIGIVAGSIEEGQNLNFAIPSNYLRELMFRARRWR